MALKIYDLANGLAEFEVSGSAPAAVTISDPNGNDVAALHFNITGSETREELIEKSSSATKRINQGTKYWVGYNLKVPPGGFAPSSFCVLGFQTHTDISAQNSPVNEVRINGSSPYVITAASNPSLPNDAEEIDITQYYPNDAFVQHTWEIINSEGSDSLARLYINNNPVAVAEWLTAGSLNPADGGKTYLKWGLYGSQGPAPIEIHLVKEIRVFVGEDGFDEVAVNFGSTPAPNSGNFNFMGSSIPIFGNTLARFGS